MGCDWPKDASVCSLSISIHAPQWGATGDGSRRPRSGLISIHAPQWGATTAPGVPRPATADFNPRTPVGCDPYPWGIVPWISHFNPRTPVGCDCCIATHMGLAYVFQSTHPSGVRPTLCGVLAGLVDFNPRTPVGCDMLAECDLLDAIISIHAPQWGATCRFVLQQRQPIISIHAPQWGATVSLHSTHTGSPYFNPRTPVGCDFLRCFRRQDAHVISIHAPQWGATCRPQVRASSRCYFNPRTPVGCDYTHPVALIAEN